MIRSSIFPKSAIVGVLTAATVTALALLWSFFSPRNEDAPLVTAIADKTEEQGTKGKAYTARSDGDVAPNPAETTEQLTPAERKTVEDAQKDLNENLSRLHQIISHEYPRLLEKRNEEAPNWKAVYDFGYEFRRKYMQEHKAEAQQYLQVRGAIWDKLDKFARTEQQLGTTSKYLQALSSAEPVGTSTLGEITRDLLTNTEYYESLRRSLAEVERTIFKDEQMAARVEAIGSGEELIELLAELAPRHEVRREEVAAQIPLAPEVRAFLSGLDYAVVIRGITDTYKRSWSSDLAALSKEAQSLQATLVRLLDQLPANSPERSELASQYSEVLLGMSQLRAKIKEIEE